MTLHELILAGAMLFAIGMYTLLARRSLIAMLVGIELMLGAASLNFMAFGFLLAPDPAVAQVIVLFSIGLAAAEAAIAISIILSLYWSRNTADVEDLTRLKG